MRWARLTWQAEDPASLARDLARRLGVRSRPGGMVARARLLDLGNAILEVRPWVREGPDDQPRRGGRLLLEPVPGGDPEPVPAPGAPLRLLGLGWATVELERAEAELEPWLGPPAPGNPRTDRHLGATALVRTGAGLPGDWTVLLEPATEGGAAASLARDGEGPCALYLRSARGLDAWLDGSREVRDGPFGRQVLLPGPFTGPFVIVTEGVVPAAGGSSPGTIGA
jgi:hypothetical protein